MLRKLNLTTRMILSICSVAVLAFAITIFVVAQRATEMVEADALAKVEQMAGRYANQVRLTIEEAVTVSQDMASLVLGWKTSGVTPQRTVLDKVIATTLENYPTFLGIWVAMEPNALDGRDADFKDKPDWKKSSHNKSGRYMPWWNRGGGIHLEPCSDPDELNFYKIPLTSKKHFMTPPSIWDIEGLGKTMMVDYCVPIIINGKAIGVAGADFSMAQLGKIIGGLKPYDTGFAFLVSDGGALAAYPNPELLGKNIKEANLPPK